MKRPGFILLLVFISVNVFAQKQGVFFKMKYLPGLTYTCTQTINSLTQINFTGDTTELKKLPVSQLPIVVQNKSSLKYEIRTEGTKFQKNFSGIVQYLYNGTKNLINGALTDTVPDTLKGKNFALFFVNGLPQLDTLKDNIPDTLKKSIAGMINGININFPVRPLKPGDIFVQDVPLQIAVSGKQVILKTHTVYKLTAIKSNTAFFDVSQTAVLKTSAGQGDLEINGTGTGHIFYDMQYGFLRLYQNTLDLKFTTHNDKLTMIGSSSILSVYQNSIK